MLLYCCELCYSGVLYYMNKHIIYIQYIMNNSLLKVMIATCLQTIFLKHIVGCLDITIIDISVVTTYCLQVGLHESK